MSFEKLMGELQAAQAEQETLAKGLPQGDVTTGGAGEKTDPGGSGEKKPEGEPTGELVVKSFEVTLANGEKAEAIDGTELVKSLQAQVTQLTGKLTSQEDTMAKAMGQMVNLVKGYAPLIKSLTDQVAALSNEGRGRKAVVNVVGKPGGTEVHQQEDGGITKEQFLAKADSALKNKILSGAERNTIDVSLRVGHPLDPALIAKVLQA